MSRAQFLRAYFDYYHHARAHLSEVELWRALVGLAIGGGVVKLTGAGLIQITAITEPGHLYEGVSIFQSRTNFADATIHGTTSMYLTDGTYYFPENHLDLGGTGIAVGSQLITHTLYIHGNGAFTINYDGSNPPPGYVAFLVE